ncbi:MAG: hypothetical protein P8Y67_02655 [Alphaproteobacteria bacterium]
MGFFACAPEGEKARCNSCIALLFAAFAALLPASAWAEAFRIAPNSRIALEVGGSFKASRNFSGFLNEQSGVSFVTSEMPASAYDDVKAIGDSPTALAQQGITITHKGVLPGRKGEYVYITGRQRSGSVQLKKYLLILRQNGVTGMITVNVPQAALASGQITKEKIEHILTTAKVVPATQSKEEAFWLEYQGHFKVAVQGPSKIYSLTGAPPESLAVDPLFVVSTDQSDAPTPKLAARQAFKLIGGFRNHILKTEKEITIHGANGYSITGQAEEIRTGKAVGIYFVMLPGNSGNYHVMIGTAPIQEMRIYLAEFKKMARSFKTRH